MALEDERQVYIDAMLGRALRDGKTVAFSKGGEIWIAKARRSEPAKANGLTPTFVVEDDLDLIDPKALQRAYRLHNDRLAAHKKRYKPGDDN